MADSPTISVSIDTYGIILYMQYQKQRNRSKKEKRAIKMIRQETAPLRGRVFTPENGKYNAFSVKRFLTNQLLERTILRSLDPFMDDIKAYKCHGLTIVYPKEGYHIQRLDNSSFNQDKLKLVKSKIEESCDETITSSIGGVCITGAQKGRVGTRYVSLKLLPETYESINSERINIYKALGTPLLPKTLIPHISIAQTSNYEVAEEIVQLKEIQELEGLAIELKPPNVRGLRLDYMDGTCIRD